MTTRYEHRHYWSTFGSGSVVIKLTERIRREQRIKDTRRKSPRRGRRAARH